MEILKISGLAFAIITISAILKQTKPEFAIQVVLIATVLLFTFALSLSTTVYDYILQLCNLSGIKSEYLKIVFKIIAISYISEFTASLCRDAGESAVAVKIEMVGKLIIIASSLPVFKELISLLSGMVV